MAELESTVSAGCIIGLITKKSRHGYHVGCADYHKLARYMALPLLLHSAVSSYKAHCEKYKQQFRNTKCCCTPSPLIIITV